MTDSALICGLVTDGTPIRGSIRSTCSTCGKQVWVAPSGQELLARGPLSILCVPCGLTAMALDPEAERVPLSRAQVDELEDELRRRRGDDA